jgi:RiboL-PSP-HEPN
MSKPYTPDDLSMILDLDLSWRRKELSDMKAAAKSADAAARPALVRAIIAMCYAHWEGYVRTCANRYFEHLTLKRRSFADFERQIYVNSFLARIDGLHRGRVNLIDRCELVNNILDGHNKRFSYINSDLVDTRSNLNTDVVKDICIICGLDGTYFESQRSFLDLLLLKRRNAIAHGQQEFIGTEDIDKFIADVLAIMSAFRSLIENKVYLKTYAA